MILTTTIRMAIVTIMIMMIKLRIIMMWGRIVIILTVSQERYFRCSAFSSRNKPCNNKGEKNTQALVRIQQKAAAAAPGSTDIALIKPFAPPNTPIRSPCCRY